MDGTPHILVVDDDGGLRVLLSDFLTRNGYRASLAQSGAAMTQTLRAADIDLVILDIMMPGEDGLSLCRRLRISSALPIIMLTAMGKEMDRVLGLEMEADDYLAKPFGTQELLARIGSWTHGRRRPRLRVRGLAFPCVAASIAFAERSTG